MRANVWICLFALFFVCIMPYNVYADSSDAAMFDVRASGAVLLDADSGRVLAQHQMDAVLPMASTTKIMTALVVLEHAQLNDVVVIQKNMCGVEGSSIYLEEGEKLTVEQLLYGLMLRSGNDAAIALAIHCAGSVENFAGLMNARAEQMGLSHTHFENPHGLPHPEHVTTAYELACIAREAMQNETFRKIVSADRFQIPWAGHEWDRVLKNKNKILSLVEGATGIKTGYTKSAGRCLVSSASRDGTNLIMVTLDCVDDFQTHKRWLDSAFEQYETVDVFKEGQTLAFLPGLFGRKAVAAGQSLSIAISKGEHIFVKLCLPESVGIFEDPYTHVGIAKVQIGGEPVCEVPLVYAQDELNAYWNHISAILYNW